ncbi:dethiobiotin synthase [Crassaminicella thermophila]|uniref:ATP-dependent dethiobiotin synthetase BioD n=1 Tax=Crassaminicella thermophila TaxID=2599308 RepID=A0A5C0SBS0_CRATE|nr:dethiobiotin synthase [Crassaminicella thermophila]QEK11362.1 dethiobiotin synthase [Crassaminicella thermophila]
MSKGLFIIGTDTDVGKTVVTAGLIHLLRSKNYDACYFKPVLSGAAFKNGQFIPGDTNFVKTLGDIPESLENMTPYSFKTPVSPHLAAKIENVAIQVSIIKQKFEDLKQKYPYMVVEGAGGLIVPLKAKYMLYDLVKDLHLPIVVVGRAGLGTINHTLLTVRYAQSVGIKVKGIILNGYDSSNKCHLDNKKTIKELTKLSVLTIPKLKDINVEKIQLGNLKNIIKENLDVKTLIEWMEPC